MRYIVLLILYVYNNRFVYIYKCGRCRHQINPNHWLRIIIPLKHTYFYKQRPHVRSRMNHKRRKNQHDLGLIFCSKNTPIDQSHWRSCVRLYEIVMDGLWVSFVNCKCHTWFSLLLQGSKQSHTTFFTAIYPLVYFTDSRLAHRFAELPHPVGVKA